MLSIVVPVFNEEESLPIFYKDLIRIVPQLDKPYEIIFVDDGSTDSSLEVLKELAQKDNTIRIFSFRKNQGKAEALTFGFQKAKGDYIITIDADLQDKPTEIQKLLEKIKNGWDLACGWREERQDSSLKVFPSKIFNLLTSFFWETRLHDYNCGLKAFKRDAAKSLRLYGGMHRFIPLLIHKEGFMVFTKKFFDYLRLREMIELALNRLVEDKQLAVYFHEGYWSAMDTYQDLEDMNKQWKRDPAWTVWK